MIGNDRKATGNLKTAIRDVRLGLADRGDVVVELREAEHARLALLAEALQDVIRDIPGDHEEFSLAVLPGDPPRLWVDATSFVSMGRDKRTYQFIKDSRIGRTILSESTSQDTIAAAITRYIAERIVEREQALEGDWTTVLIRRKAGVPDRQRPAAGEGSAWLSGVIGFSLGVMTGILGLLAYAWAMVD